MIFSWRERITLSGIKKIAAGETCLHTADWCQSSRQWCQSSYVKALGHSGIPLGAVPQNRSVDQKTSPEPPPRSEL